jgi:amidase
LLKGFRKYKSELNKGFNMNTNHYGEVMLRKNQITERWEQFFESYDFLICPVSYGPAYRRCPIGTTLNHGGKEMPYVEYAWPYNACFNASGHPAIQMPLGMSEDGLPFGVQIVGPYWSEPELLNFARLISELTMGFVKPEGY